MYKLVVLSLCAINYCMGQSISSPPVDWIQTDGTGAYRFGYATGDEGRHYHVSSATADNTVAGRFGYKDPATGGDLQTTYTAGRRGFRARGPHIARRMDLSQTKPPFSRPNDDGQYHPELDNIFDPNEDRGYDFSYRTPDHIKEEHANRVGDVQGRYSYLDDIGFRHNVEYIAGSNTGFVVTNPVPDTFAQARGGPLYFVGKTGGSKVRGFSAVQKNLNGAYRFVASGPDHKRSEVTDAAGNRRGVYTYLDDKNIQHTVEYIAGPKIGYKVINNRKGVNYNPILPYFPDSSTVQPLFPSVAGGSGGSGSKPLGPLPPLPSSPSPPSGGDLFPPLPPTDVSGFAPFPSAGGSGPSSISPTSPSSTAKPSGGSSSGDSSTGRPPLFKPSSVRPPPSLIDTPSSVPPFSFEQPDDFPSISPTFPSTSPFPIPARPQRPVGFEDSDQKWNYDFDYFFNDPANTNKDWSKPIKGQSGSSIKGSTPATPSKPPSFDLFPDFPPSSFPDPAFLVPDPFNEGLNTAESGNGLKPPFGSQDKDCNNTDSFSSNNKGDGSSIKGSTDRNDQRENNYFSGSGSSSGSSTSSSSSTGFSTGFGSGSGSGSNSGSSSGSGSGFSSGSSSGSSTGSGSSFSSGSGSSFSSGSKGTKESGAKHYYKGQKGLQYPSRGTVKFGGVKKDEWHKFDKEDGYFSIPPGVAVRAHVQSLDIVPYKRYVSPGEALEHHDEKKPAEN